MMIIVPYWSPDTFWNRSDQGSTSKVHLGSLVIVSIVAVFQLNDQQMGVIESVSVVVLPSSCL